MAKGVAEKGYKMTNNRRAILGLLLEEGGSIKSGDGRATSLMGGLLVPSPSMAALNASLRELENLQWIKRNIDGRRTFGIEITALGKKILAEESGTQESETGNLDTAPVVQDPEVPGPPAEWNADEAAARIRNQAAHTNGTGSTETSEPGPTDAVAPEEWDWDAEKTALPGEIDYDILLGVFLKAAIRGMEGPSNGEVDYHKQQTELAHEKIAILEDRVAKFRAEAASAIAERDQLQKNLNIIMSKSEQKKTRGSDPVRNLLSPDERVALDNLMRQIPTSRGE